MALTYAHALILLLGAFMVSVNVATRFSYGSHRLTLTDAHSPNKIVVGGSAKWTFGFNYSDWAFKNAPFYVNDTLVFKYDPPSESNIHPHNVYLLPDLLSFETCNLTNAAILANESQGAGEGFEFVLKDWQPHYIACGAGNGFHCNNGTMKFVVLPTCK